MLKLLEASTEGEFLIGFRVSAMVSLEILAGAAVKLEGFKGGMSSVQLMAILSSIVGYQDSKHKEFRCVSSLSLES